MNLDGIHYVSDALAAITVGLSMGVTPEEICLRLAEFQNMEGRQEIIREKGCLIIKDCYNAGPESMDAALQVLSLQKGRKIAVLGGMLELGDHAPEAHGKVGGLTAQRADLLFAYGQYREYYLQAAAGMAYAEGFASHEALVQALLERVQPGDCLLFKGSRGMHMERALQLFLDSYHGGDRDE
jgi:UDP-N-acetylmuramyl pentapeptide synthase